MENLKQSAIKYAELGYKIFPCVQGGKNPATKAGFKDATKDIKQIEKWWNENPNYNIGLPTGEINQIVVVDCDIHPDMGADGYRDFVEFSNEYGEIPDTVLSITQSGGYHFIFKTDKAYRSRIKVYGSIDIRANGGYIVAPPSVGSEGEYQWECGYEIDEFPMAEANETIDKLVNLKKDGSANEGLPEELGEGKRNDLLFKEGCRLRASGYKEAEILASLSILNSSRCSPPLGDDEVKIIAKSCASYEAGKKINVPVASLEQEGDLLDGTLDFDLKNDNTLKQTIHNATLFLENSSELKGKIGWNELAGTIYCMDYMPWRKHGKSFREWDNSDIMFLNAWLERKGINNKENIYNALSNVAHAHCFNPITEMLDKIYQEYGSCVGYVDKLLPIYLGVEDTEYQREVMRTFMLGAVARAYEPGVKFDYMLVFTGAQGAGKSTFFRRLAMDDRFYNENLSVADSDKALEKIRGIWIAEMAELAAMKRSKDVESVKAFISTTTDIYRAPYEKLPESHPRRCVLVGTTNNKDFLTDSTGNRRFLIVDVHKEKVKDRTRDSLVDGSCREDFAKAWGEIISIYKSGNYTLRLEGEVQEKAERMQDEYADQDPMASIVLDWLDRVKPDKVCAAMVRMEVFGEDLATATWDRRKISAINSIMDNFATDYERAQMRLPSPFGRCRGWKRKDSDEFEDGGEVPFD